MRILLRWTSNCHASKQVSSVVYRGRIGDPSGLVFCNL